MNYFENDNLDFIGFSQHEDSLIQKLVDCRINEPLFVKRIAEEKQLAHILPHVIIQRAFQMGLIPYKGFAHWLLSHRENGWRSDEIDYLIRHSDRSRKTIGMTLGRSSQSVAKQCYELRLNNGAHLHKWTERELNFLSQNFLNLNIKLLQASLNRSRIDIKNKMLQLGFLDKTASIQFTGRPISKKVQNTSLEPKDMLPKVT